MSEIPIGGCAMSLVDDYRNQQVLFCFFFDNVLLHPIEDDGGS